MRPSPLALPLLAVVATACSSDATPWFPDELDKGALISEKSGAGAATTCQAFEDYLYAKHRDDLLVELVCTAFGIDQTNDVAACDAYVTECRANPPASVATVIDSVVDATGCGGLTYQPATCGETLGALATCLAASEAELRAMRDRLSCDAAAQPLPPDALTPAAPPACQALEAACPAAG